MTGFAIVAEDLCPAACINVRQTCIMSNAQDDVRFWPRFAAF